MSLRADTHVHVYPQHQAAVTLRAAIRHLGKTPASPGDAYALLLTEAASCNWFASLKDGSHGLPADFQILPSPEAESVEILFDQQRIHVFAGRQIVTAERLELLALTLAEIPEDGQPAEAVLTDIQSRGAVPVLAWAPGKWMFSRAEKVRQLIDGRRGPLLLGDSSLRCLGWPRPGPMRRSAYPLLAGSDPLPFPGEEKQAGRYGVEIEMILDPGAPVSSLRKALMNPATPCRLLGRRNRPDMMLKRMLAHRQTKHTEPTT